MGKVDIGQLKGLAVLTGLPVALPALGGSSPIPGGQGIWNPQTGSQGAVFGLSQGTQLAAVRLILAAHDKKL